MPGPNPQAPALRERFAAIVAALRPSSVLDVGCGAGAVLDLLVGRDIPARGVESDPPTAAAARARGHAVSTADATRLPFPDHAFDLVVMRHVPHHLPDPAAALAEARRVARRGLVVAEPRYDPLDPAQRLAEEIDLLLKTLHRRQGRHHAPNLSAEDLLALLPTAASRDVAIDIHHLPARVPLAAVDAELEPLLTSHGTVAERARYAALRRRARDGTIAANGSVTLTVLEPQAR